MPATTPFLSAPEWIPEVAIIDAMFAININPLRQHKSLEQYAYLLFGQFVIPHYQHGTNEVHLVFDNPQRVAFNPKDCEHKRRYSRAINTAKSTTILHSPQNQQFLGHGGSILNAANARGHWWKHLAGYTCVQHKVT